MDEDPPEIEHIDLEMPEILESEPLSDNKEDDSTRKARKRNKRDVSAGPSEDSKSSKAARKRSKKDGVSDEVAPNANRNIPPKSTIPVSEITFEDCPFRDCPIVIQTIYFEHHKEICPFNLTVSTQMYYCLFIGCQKQFKTKEELLTHFKKCFYSIPGDLQKELQLEIAEKGVKIK